MSVKTNFKVYFKLVKGKSGGKFPSLYFHCVAFGTNSATCGLPNQCQHKKPRLLQRRGVGKHTTSDEKKKKKKEIPVVKNIKTCLKSHQDKEVSRSKFPLGLLLFFPQKKKPHKQIWLECSGVCPFLQFGIVPIFSLKNWLGSSSQFSFFRVLLQCHLVIICQAGKRGKFTEQTILDSLKISRGLFSFCLRSYLLLLFQMVSESAL